VTPDEVRDWPVETFERHVVYARSVIHPEGRQSGG